ncbi:threonine/serine exporter family protein [Lysinibacillus endophyticus]|uniref:Threonine/serine exporter n=1 Tax=Ureibacillus endophyticus TaxID=1978490 RepID=A0A494ZAG2_9BACL|nr:threonine/serine exporter family protein [Lysinibacillus endophyticus]MCP1143414.1 threonine/serine exporter family protein [Lysinibacillus endophyticus]RKQ19039.1 threonine/serine exporter [Lysinibacillus endophyticus]
MEIFLQLLFSFIFTACFGVIFNAPTKAIPYCGLVGSIGWIVYYVLMDYGVTTEVQSSFIGAFIVAIVAQVFARRFKMPMIIFNVSGIIPLVPGGIAYNTMRNIVELDYNLGIQNGMRAFMISGAIAMGLVFAEVIIQLVMRMFNKGKTSMQTYARAKRREKGGHL